MLIIAHGLIVRRSTCAYVTSAMPSRPNFFTEEMSRVRSEMTAEQAAVAEGRQAPLRSLVSGEDKAVIIPGLIELSTELDRVVAASSRHGTDGPKSAAMYRLGSVAAHRHQIDFYYRVATSPAVRTICEVGFNAGHSTAVWLAANPAATIHSFDLFRQNYSVQTLAYLQGRFPGRIVPHSGDSTRSIPATALSPPCDLVHVDGRHSYLNVVQDFVNLLIKSRDDALFLFDDQCEAARCTARPFPVPGQPALATCDLVSSRMIQRIAASYEGQRQFALYRARPGAREEAAARLGSLGQQATTHDEVQRVTGRRLARRIRSGPFLPCSELCAVRWHGLEAKSQAVWDRDQKPALLRQQRQLRPPGCNFSRISI